MRAEKKLGPLIEHNGSAFRLIPDSVSAGEKILPTKGSIVYVIGIDDQFQKTLDNSGDRFNAEQIKCRKVGAFGVVNIRLEGSFMGLFAGEDLNFVEHADDFDNEFKKLAVYSNEELCLLDKFELEFLLNLRKNGITKVPTS